MFAEFLKKDNFYYNYIKHYATRMASTNVKMEEIAKTKKEQTINMNLPKVFEEKMKDLLGSEYEAYTACYDEPRHYGLRVNTAKISVEDFLKIAPWPLEPVPWIHNGFYYDGDNIQPSQNLIGTDGNFLATQRYGSDHTDYLLYHKDIQGSTTSLVKEDGSADATYRYTDFGETTINGDNKAENEVCYTGGIYDQSTGLYYLNARYYNPEDGRFMTEDTYRGDTTKSETGHLYVYCANNPVNYVDPSGHKAKTVLYYNKKGKGFKKQAMHSPYYKNSQVTFKSVIKKAQFKKEWDKIPKGTSELYLYLHGGVSCLYFDGSDMNLKELLALKKKKIKKKIVLLSCKGGIGDKNGKEYERYDCRRRAVRYCKWFSAGNRGSLLYRRNRRSAWRSNRFVDPAESNNRSANRNVDDLDQSSNHAANMNTVRTIKKRKT